jgi:predicted DCC family thiol-disulfide oxidoreductase YuxK
MKRKPCSTCNHPQRTVFFYKECNVCRAQWKAFYRGDTPVSPLMRAIEAEKAERYVA